MTNTSISSWEPAYADPGHPDYVVVCLRGDSGVGYSRSGFVAPSNAAISTSLNALVESFDVVKIRSHFMSPSPEVKARAIAPRPQEVAMADQFELAGFVQLHPGDPSDCSALVARLRKEPGVKSAFVAPRPLPAATPTNSDIGTRNFEPAQGYLVSPPDGIGAVAVWGRSGGSGEGVRVCDVEGNWLLSHEDLPPNIPRLGGTPIPGITWRDHGTAVLGVLASVPNDFGNVGICHGAEIVVQSAMIGGVVNMAAALVNAADQLSPGDCLLIEMQGAGPNGRYVAMQYWEDVFLAIEAVTAKGIHVVEAAGNGDEDFDDPAFHGTGLSKHAGAVMVGAGVPPSNFLDHAGVPGLPGYSGLGPPRSRLFLSNYGRIVDVQGWGWHVATLGFGDAQGGAEKRWYTLRFSGTSSASAVVAGAVACIQGHAKARWSRVLAPAEMLRLLIDTGTPQKFGATALPGHIGPQPDLERAFAALADLGTLD